MLKILQNSTTKLNSYAKCQYQVNYLSRVITAGDHLPQRIINIPSCRYMSGNSVKNRAPEARSKFKNDQCLKSNSNNPQNLLKCPPPGFNPTECYPRKPKQKDSGQSTPPVPPTPENSSSNSTKWIVGVLAGIGGGALLYYLTQGDEKDQSKSKLGKDKSSTGLPIPIKVPLSSADIPKQVPYLLIGGGTASFSAFRAIKSHDPKAKVMVISNEYHKPYMRPPLSKELWYNAEKDKGPDEDFRFKQWNGASRSLFYEPKEFYVDPTKLLDTANGGVAVCHGYSIKKILPYEQKAILSDGTEITYEKCLIATGCSPKSLDVISSASQRVKEKVTSYRNPDDFICLKAVVDKVQSITIIGSGFLGSELACALSKYGKDRDLKVYQVYQENGNMAKVLPDYLSNWTTKNVEKQGVNVVPSVQITSIERIHDKLKLNLNNGQAILTEHVVVCTGCEANTDIAKLSGLEVDDKFGGFLVNAELEARKNLFVAGDAACFFDPLLGRRRVEHHDHSVVSGRLAGENMTGLKHPYKHQSMFWSDLGPELGYEGIGLIDSSLPTVGVFAKMDASTVPEERGHLFKTPPSESSSENITEKKNTQNQNSSITNAQKSSEEEAANAPVEQQSSNNSSTSTSVASPEVDDYGRGVIFYLKDKKVVGILLWNIFNRIGLARQIINQNMVYDDLNEVAKLFEIHS